jgi:hypothetical protein
MAALASNPKFGFRNAADERGLSALEVDRVRSIQPAPAHKDWTAIRRLDGPYDLFGSPRPRIAGDRAGIREHENRLSQIDG